MNKFFVVLICLLIFACSTNTENSNRTPDKKDQLLKAHGRSDEILVVIDQKLWSSQEGEFVRNLMKTSFPGVIRSEPYFRYKYTNQENFHGSLARFHNVIIPVFMNDSSSTTSYYKNRLKINNNQLPNYKTVYNTHASGQQITYLVLKDYHNFEVEFEQNLLGVLNDQAARHRGQDVLSPQNSVLEKEILDETGYTLTVPSKYKKVAIDSSFTWLRKMSPELDLNVVISRGSYDSQVQFSDTSILSAIQNVSSRLYGQDSSDYVMIEQAYEPYFREKNIGGNYIKEVRGLWKMSRAMMGGSYLVYALLDRQNENIYYIEGLVYAPEQQKAKHLREIQAILNSFSILRNE